MTAGWSGRLHMGWEAKQVGVDGWHRRHIGWDATQACVVGWFGPARGMPLGQGERQRGRCTPARAGGAS